ncbi:MAG: LysR family transcriptional regulator [Myxococcota bacterium]
MLTDLNLFRSLVAVADEGSHAAAANRLHITPSAVSQQIKTLEAQLEVPAFERVGRRSVLTRDGEELVDRVRPLLIDLEAAVEQHRERHRELAGVVRIGSATGFFAAWLRPRLMPFLQEHPRLKLSAKLTLLSHVQSELAGGHLDLGIAVGAPEHPQIDAAPLYQQSFIAVAVRGLLAQDALAAADLRQHPFLVFDQDQFMHRDWWHKVFGAQQVLPDNISHEIGNIFELRAFMEAGFGVAVLPEFFVRDSLSAGSVVRVTPLDDDGQSITKEVRSTVHLLWRRRSVEPRRVAAVREMLLACASDQAVPPRY